MGWKVFTMDMSHQCEVSPLILVRFYVTCKNMIPRFPIFDENLVLSFHIKLTLFYSFEYGNFWYLKILLCQTSRFSLFFHCEHALRLIFRSFLMMSNFPNWDSKKENASKRQGCLCRTLHWHQRLSIQNLLQTWCSRILFRTASCMIQNLYKCRNHVYC